MEEKDIKRILDIIFNTYGKTTYEELSLNGNFNNRRKMVIDKICEFIQKDGNIYLMCPKCDYSHGKYKENCPNCGYDIL